MSRRRGWIRRPPLLGAALDRALDDRLGWSVDAMQRWGQRQLRGRLELARRLPAYVGCGPALADFPRLDRGRLGADPDAFADPRWPRSLLREVATSGSSGRPIRFWRDPGSALMEEAFLRRQLRAYGVDGGPALAIRAEGPRSGPSRLDRAPTRDEWRLAASRIDDEAVRQVVDLVERRRVRLLRAYPSAAVELVRRADDLGLLGRLRRSALAVAHLSSETLTDAAEERISDGLGVRIAEQYGLAERALLIQSCPAGSRHLISDYAVGEIVDGEWLGTPLFGGGAVLVRYGTGDLADGGIGASDCACGWPFPRVGRVLGRTDAVITTSDGRRVGRLGPALRGIPGLLAVQAELRPGGLRVRYVAAPGAPEVGDALRRSIAALLRDDGTAIELLEEPPRRGTSGRVRVVIDGESGE